MALASQYGWQLAGLMLIGAALMRSGWLSGQFSLQHYRRAAALLLTIGWLIAIPGVLAQWLLQWIFRWSGFFLQVPRDLASPFISLTLRSVSVTGRPSPPRASVTPFSASAAWR